MAAPVIDRSVWHTQGRRLIDIYSIPDDEHHHVFYAMAVAQNTIGWTHADDIELQSYIIWILDNADKPNQQVKKGTISAHRFWRMFTGGNNKTPVNTLALGTVLMALFDEKFEPLYMAAKARGWAAPAPVDVDRSKVPLWARSATYEDEQMTDDGESDASDSVCTGAVEQEIKRALASLNTKIDAMQQAQKIEHRKVSDDIESIRQLILSMQQQLTGFATWNQQSFQQQPMLRRPTQLQPRQTTPVPVQRNGGGVHKRKSVTVRQTGRDHRR